MVTGKIYMSDTRIDDTETSIGCGSASGNTMLCGIDIVPSSVAPNKLCSHGHIRSNIYFMVE